VSEKPLFWIQMLSYDLLDSMAIGLFIVVFYVSTSLPSVGFLLLGLCSIGCICYFGWQIAYLHRATKIREAKFFEDHAEFGGKGFERRVDYLQMADVSTKPAHLGLKVLTVRLKEEPSEMVVFTGFTLKSRKLKTDLHSWLAEKTATRGGAPEELTE